METNTVENRNNISELRMEYDKLLSEALFYARKYERAEAEQRQLWDNYRIQVKKWLKNGKTRKADGGAKRYSVLQKYNKYIAKYNEVAEKIELIEQQIKEEEQNNAQH